MYILRPANKNRSKSSVQMLIRVKSNLDSSIFFLGCHSAHPS